MDNKETADYLRNWVKEPHSPFSWPTDICGYDQHIKFVEHRNKNFDQISKMSNEEFKQFVLNYANELDKEVKG